jgi:ATP-binding cassette subfamily C exporter for protease/lipase
MKRQVSPRRTELSETLWLFRRELLVCVIFTVVVNVLMLTPALYMMQVFDRVMLSGSELTLFALTAVMLLFFAVMAFAEWSRARLLVRASVKFDQRLNSRVFHASFQEQLAQSGTNPSRPFSDLTTIRQFLTGQGLFAFLDAPWTPLYVAVLFLLHPWLGWLSICFALIQLGVATIGHSLTQQPLNQAQEAGMEVNAYLHSKLKNVEVIEAMGMLVNLRRNWQVRHQRHLAINHEAQRITNRMKALSKLVLYTQQSLALGVAAMLVLRGELNPVSIFVANVLIGRATAPTDLLVSSWKPFFSAGKSYRRLKALLAKHPARMSELASAQVSGRIRIDNLVAAAPARAVPILKGLSADFPAGQMTAIVGASGSGKTTLARCLLGIWPNFQGQVSMDGESLQSWSRDQLGPNIGYLPQDMELFDGTIAENIARFGSLDSDKVLAAAGRAGVHDMILRLPRGYDTMIGEAGRLLSGGQRQRIGLARAMYGAPRLIVLDEPNSNLDESGDLSLITALRSLREQGCTVFVITHRSNIVCLADRILLLEDGCIRTYGPTAEVFAALRPASSANAMLAEAAPQAQ